jgi:flagellar basal-body rod protein FlgB
VWNDLFSSVDLLEKGIGASWLRNEVISNNIANVDTPGFKASDVEFEDIMAAAVGRGDGSVGMTVTNEKHISANAAGVSDVEAVVTTDETTSAGLDENNVNIENEMTELAKNSIEYYTLVSKVNSEFRNLNTAINVT